MNKTTRTLMGLAIACLIVPACIAESEPIGEDTAQGELPASAAETIWKCKVDCGSPTTYSVCATSEGDAEKSKGGIKAAKQACDDAFGHSNVDESSIQCTDTGNPCGGSGEPNGDVDGDGIPDHDEEAHQDADGDGIPDGHQHDPETHDPDTHDPEMHDPEMHDPEIPHHPGHPFD